MENQRNDAESAYFGLAETWDEELFGKLKRDRFIALVVAGVSAALAAMAIIAVMLLTPLKSVQPYMVMVDKTTGYAEAVRELAYTNETPLAEQEIYVMAEINKYILNRHTYDPMDVNRRYMGLRLTSSPPVFGDFDAELAGDQGDLGTSSRRTVKVKSIIPNLQTKTAQIRFSTSIKTLNGPAGTRDWIATMTYDFAKLEIPMELRYINPLGFIVMNYRVDPETLQRN